jgi:hypothetical protein
VRGCVRSRSRYARGGAGGNRTLVRQAVDVPATTIPERAPCGRRAAGSAALRHRLVFPSGQRSLPAVSGLSRRPPLLLLPGCSDQAPRAIAGRCVSRYLTRSGGESEVAIGASLGAPFKESEQLRSHERLPASTSKPISPLSKSAPEGATRVYRPVSRSPWPRGPWPGGPPGRPPAGRSPGACRSPGGRGRGPPRASPARP